MLRGTSIAVLTYIGFDGISTLTDEAKDPARSVPRAIVLTCFITGILASIEVYVAQLVWPRGLAFPDIDTAYVHVSGRMGGPILFLIVNAALLLANIGSGMASQLGAARLLYAMGQDGALPRRFFGAVHPKNRIPRNNVLLIGAICLAGALVFSYQLGHRIAELWSAAGVHGSQSRFDDSRLASWPLGAMGSDAAVTGRAHHLPLPVDQSRHSGADCGHCLGVGRHSALGPPPPLYGSSRRGRMIHRPTARRIANARRCDVTLAGNAYSGLQTIRSELKRGLSDRSIDWHNPKVRTSWKARHVQSAFIPQPREPRSGHDLSGVM